MTIWQTLKRSIGITPTPLPVIGSTWELIYRTPFTERVILVTILDVKEGWVKFRYEPSPSDSFDSKQIYIFLQIFREKRI